MRFLRSLWLLLFPAACSVLLYMYAGTIVGSSPQWGTIVLLVLIGIDFMVLNAAGWIAFVYWHDLSLFREAMAQEDEEEIESEIRREQDLDPPPRSR